MSDLTPMSAHVGAYSCVHTVAKKCYECGKEWEGKAFKAQPAGAVRLPGLCGDCLDKEDAKVRALSAPRLETGPAKDTELLPPRSVGNADDDVFPADRKMLQSGER